MRRHRKRKRGGLLKLAELAGLNSTPVPLPPDPEPEPQVIPVKATVFHPIDFDHVPSVHGQGVREYEDDDCDPFGGILTSLLGIPRTRDMPDHLTHVVESRGSEEFRDKRAFSYTEENGKWKLVTAWTAEGMGSVPPAIKMLGSLQGIFNHLFNMIVGHEIEDQKVDRSTQPRSAPPALPWREDH